MNYSGLSSEDFVRICASRGDNADAWEEFVRRYQPFLANIVMRKTGQALGEAAAGDSVDDLVQDIFLKICADRAKVVRPFQAQYPDAIFGYLKTIAINVVYDRLRKRSARRRNGGIAWEPEEISRAVAQRETAEQVEQQILPAEIYRVAEQERPRDFQIIRLYYQHGLTAQAISALPGFALTVKGVGRRFRRMEVLKPGVPRNHQALNFRPRAAGDPMTPNSPPECASQKQMLEAEAEQIKTRRVNVAPEVHGDPYFGLAFSGGGIRSATLNLGILQGLAKRGLLPYIDYLSTVSGGGYIGSWLHGVIRNCGDGRPQAIVDYLRRPDDEPHLERGKDPIVFLRKFSSYLATDIGLFSADFWVILIIWMRNMFLNQIILITALAVAPLLLIGGGFLFQLVENPGIAPALLALLLSMICVGGAAAIAADGIAGVLDSVECDAKAQHPRGPFDNQGFTSLATILMLAASTILSAFAVTLARADRKLLLAVFLWLALLFYVMQFRGRCRNPVWAIISAAATTVLLALTLLWMSQWSGPAGMEVWLRVAFGPPLLMVVWLNGVALHLGLVGIDFQDFTREWLSRLGAFFAISATAWATLYILFIFAPYYISQWSEDVWTLRSATFAWIATTIAGVLTGNSPKTGGNDPTRESKFIKLIVAVSPTVFMIGFLLSLGIAVHAILWHLRPSCAPCQPSFPSTYWLTLRASESWQSALIMLAVCAFVAWGLQYRVNINEFSLHHFYKNRLVRCYLGASRLDKRHPSGLTGFDPCDDFFIDELKPTKGYFGPYPIINTTLNINRGTELARKERKGTAFAFTPLYCGYCPPVSREDAKASKDMCPQGYRFTTGYSNKSGPLMGACMGISGAAANPNWGSSTSAPMAFLLTVFDVRLGWWLGNTRFAEPSTHPGPVYALWWLFQELFAQTDAQSKYVNLSDGGHFENLGIYELVRRRCRYIIVGDGEEDHDLNFESLGGAIRKCRIDFGVDIEIDPRGIQRVDGWSSVQCAVGTIRYPADPDGLDRNQNLEGFILYLKSSVTNQVPEDVEQYRATHKTFPHESTANQFFTESQFESYRRLGLYIVDHSLGTLQFTGQLQPGVSGWQERFFKQVEENISTTAGIEE